MGFGIPPRAADKNFPVCEACEKDLENVQGWHNEIQLRWSQIERTMTNVLAKILSSSPPDVLMKPRRMRVVVKKTAAE